MNVNLAFDFTVYPNNKFISKRDNLDLWELSSFLFTFLDAVFCMWLVLF